MLARPLTAEIKLLLKFQPRVVVVADKKVLSVGETFTAHCEASAFPQAVEYSWYLDNNLLQWVAGKVFARLTSMLTGIFRTSNPIRGK